MNNRISKPLLIFPCVILVIGLIVGCIDSGSANYQSRGSGVGPKEHVMFPVTDDPFAESGVVNSNVHETLASRFGHNVNVKGFHVATDSKGRYKTYRVAVETGCAKAE